MRSISRTAVEHCHQRAGETAFARPKRGGNASTSHLGNGGAIDSTGQSLRTDDGDASQVQFLDTSPPPCCGAAIDTCRLLSEIGACKPMPLLIVSVIIWHELFDHVKPHDLPRRLGSPYAEPSPHPIRLSWHKRHSRHPQATQLANSAPLPFRPTCYLGATQ